MSEYIVSLPEGKADDALKAYGWDGSYLCGYELTGEVVRCRDCKHCKRREGILPPTVCERWGYHNFKTEPERYCAWGERRGDAE